MTDNVNVTEGLGKIIAADDVGGIMYQRVKVAVGTDGSATDVSSANPMPTTPLTLPPGAATQTTLAAVLAALGGTLTVTSAVGTVSTASLTSLASAATSAQFLAANTSRMGLFLINTDANAALVKFGTTASATSYTVRLVQNAYYEMPQPIYTGRVDVIWEADGSGSLFGTEI